jgi:hypothetical protein
MFLRQGEAVFRHLVTDFPPCVPRAFVVCRVNVAKSFFGDYGKGRQNVAQALSLTISPMLQYASHSWVKVLAKMHRRGKVCKRVPYPGRKVYFYVPAV